MFDLYFMWLMVGMMIPATGFPFLYATFYRWWKQPIGRALMTKAIGLALLVDLSVLYSVLGEYPGRDLAKAVVFTVIFIGLWYQFVVFIRIKREGKK